MASVGTSISGFLSGLGGFASNTLSGIDRFLGSAIPRIAPLAEVGLQTYGTIRQLQAPSPPTAPAQSPSVPSQQFVRPTGAAALPGGAPVAYVSTTGIGVPATTAGIGGSLQGLGQALTPGGSPGPSGFITAVPTRGGYRLPRLVNVANPTDPNKIETYVRAPRPRYRVSISGPRRRCRPR